jgi:hypothetical protein
MTQKESVCFSDECSIYLSDELFFKIGQKLYKSNLCEHIDSSYQAIQGQIIYDTIQPERRLQYLLPGYFNKGKVELYGPDYTSLGTIALKQNRGEIKIDVKPRKKIKYLRICAGNECGRLFSLE